MCKAVIAAVCLIIAGLSPLAAQPFELFGWGIQGGINAGYVDYAGPIPWLDPGWGIGYTFGPLVELPLATRVRLQGGLMFDHFKNHSDVDRSYGGGGWAEIVLDCVSVPMLAKVAIIGERSPFFIAGPEIEYVIRAHSRQDIGGRKSTSDMRDEVERLKLALDAGLGMEFRAGGHAIFIQGMYRHGLTNVSRRGYWLIDWQTREIAVTAGLTF
jgi:hypothetical protein